MMRTGGDGAAFGRHLGELCIPLGCGRDQQQVGIGIVVKRFYAARLDREGLHAHTHSGR